MNQKNPIFENFQTHTVQLVVIAMEPVATVV